MPLSRAPPNSAKETNFKLFRGYIVFDIVFGGTTTPVVYGQP